MRAPGPGMDKKRGRVKAAHLSGANEVRREEASKDSLAALAPEHAASRAEVQTERDELAAAGVKGLVQSGTITEKVSHHITPASGPYRLLG